MAIPVADWLRSLDDMETTLATTVAALDRHERTCASVLAEPSTIRHPTAVWSIPQTQLARLTARLGEWDALLATAADLGTSVERELNDRQATIERWQELFHGWRGLIEQPAKPAASTS